MNPSGGQLQTLGDAAVLFCDQLKLAGQSVGHMTPRDVRALTASVTDMPDLRELASLVMNHSEEGHQMAYNQKEQATRHVAQVFGEGDLIG